MYNGESVSLLDGEKAGSFSIQKRECLPSTCRAGTPLLCTEDRVSLFSIGRWQTPSPYRRASVSLLYVEEADSFRVQRGECLSFLYVDEADSALVHRRECLSFLYVDEADSFRVQGRECLSLLYRGYTTKRVSPSSICRGCRLLPCTEQRVSLCSISRRRAPSHHAGESVSLLYADEADSSSVHTRECLFSMCSGSSAPLCTED